MTPATKGTYRMEQIPSIDLGPARSGREADRKAVAQQIDRACREVGFFVVHGHGIERSLFETAYAALQDFFSRPNAEKNACRLAAGKTMPSDPYTPYGFSGLLEENAFAYMGEKGRPGDYVEKLSAGRMILDDAVVLPFNDDARGRDLRRAIKRYYQATDDVAATVMRLLTIPLGLHADFFATRMDKSNDSLRCHYYPARAAAFSNDQGMGAHRDSSLITLLTHNSPGIEVRTRSGEWIEPHFRSVDEFIVNIGDLLAHSTDMQYVSTPHRVVLSNRDRLSIVFFKLTNEDDVVQIGNRQMDALFGR
jgi:isopenicillin N synthase-like dioxygenase